MDTGPGLRERKKQRTRETIEAAAHELFVERGYHETTLPEIAEAADVATRTIFSYFPSKEDILFSHLEQMKDALAQAIAERPAGQDTLAAVRDFILSSQGSVKSHEPAIHQCISADPTLRSRLRARIAQLEDVIRPAIADDLGATEDDPRTQLVATSLTAAFNQLSERGADKSRKWTPDELRAQIDPIFTFLRAGLDALKR